MNDEKRISFLEWLMLVMVVLLLVDSIYTVAYATERNNSSSDAVLNSTVNSNPVLSGGDSKAYGLSNNMGDVDIGPCYGSRQWNTPVYGRQGYTLLLVQCAERLDTMGLHLAAALMRCKDDDYAALFVSRTECLQLSTIPEDVALPAPESDKDDEDYHEQHEQDFAAAMEALEARLAASERKVAQAKAEARKARRTAQTPPQTIIEPWMTDEKRAKLQAVLDE